MSEPDASPAVTSSKEMFLPPTKIDRAFPTTAVSIAATAILILVAVLVLFGRRPPAAPNTLHAADAYAPNLLFSNIELSEATIPLGGKSTYIDGHIANHGNLIVNGVVLQLLFANDQAMPPQLRTMPLTLIRMREPYVDIQPIAAAPLAPGAEADFRLILEDVAANWNQRAPEIHVIHVSTR